MDDTTRKPADNEHISLTTKQIKYIAAIAAGKEKKEAIQEAGYSEGTKPSHVESKKGVQKAIVKAMEVIGINDDYLGEKIKEGLEAKKVNLVVYKGSVTEKIETPDHENRHKYVTTALKLRGDLDEEGTKIDVNMGIIEVPKVAESIEDWNNRQNIA